jgi:hypothetical protein
MSILGSTIKAKKINLGDTYCDIEGYLCILKRRVLRLSIWRGNIQGLIARDIQGGENRMSNEKHFEKAICNLMKF